MGSTARWFARSWIAFAALLPLLTYFVFVTWLRPISPFFANYDPEFQYMLNSLEVFNGRSYYYADHPGGPVEVIGTLIYLGTYPALGLGLNRFIEYHLTHPSVFLTIAHGLLLVLSSVTMAYLTTLNRPKHGVARLPFASLVGLLYFALHPLAWDSLVIWSHNSFGFAVGALLLAILYRLLLETPAEAVVDAKRLFILSLGAGLLATVTIYFAAWIVAVVLILAVWHILIGASFRSAASVISVAIAGGLAGIILGIIPLWHRMPYFTDWIRAITSHQHPYLLIAPDRPLLTQWALSFRLLLAQLPLLFAALLLCLVLSIAVLTTTRRAWKQDAAPVSFTLVLPLICIMLVVAILDHAKVDYMLAVAAVLPVWALALERLWRPFLSAHRRHEHALTSLLLIGTVVALAAAMLGHASRSTRIARIEQRTAQLQKAFAKERGRGLQSLVVVWTYGTYSPCFSLWFANDSTDNAFRREIGRLCPRQIAYDYFAEMVIPRQGAQKLDDKAWDMVIGCAEAFKKPELASLPRSVTFPGLALSCGDLTVAYREP